MATTARWIASLSLGFGLVSIPVRLFTATESASAVRFNMLTKDGQRVKQQYVSALAVVLSGPGSAAIRAGVAQRAHSNPPDPQGAAAAEDLFARRNAARRAANRCCRRSGDGTVCRSALGARNRQLVLDLQLTAKGGTVATAPIQTEDQGTSKEADLVERFARAEALEEQDPNAAEALYRHVLVDDPGHAHAYLNLGFMLCESGRCESAVQLYDDGIRFCPDDPLIHFNRAVALEGVGDVKAALASYEESLRLQPDLLDAHRNAAVRCSMPTAEISRVPSATSARTGGSKGKKVNWRKTQLRWNTSG